MKNIRYSILSVIMATGLLMGSCEDFVEVELPNHKVVTETVFAEDETAIAAMNGIYNELFNSEFSSGGMSSVTVLAGMSSDIFETTSATDTRFGPFQQNQISPIESPDAIANYGLWSSAYNIIYMANGVLEGVEYSKSISEEVREKLKGQALFIRAFTYLYLTSLYGEVPLTLTTDYRQNLEIPRSSTIEVFKQIGPDLDLAMDFLERIESYESGERTKVNLFAVMALRARVYLYQKNWEKAEELSSKVIAQTWLYEILEDLDRVFLMNSKEAIWQISPLGGLGGGQFFTYTQDGFIFRGNNSSAIKLSEDNLLSTMQAEDKRLSQWVGFNETKDFYYPNKYKDGNSWQNVTEYSMVLRLAEQYLIRAEARTMQGRLSDAIKDVDKIRHRASLNLIADTNPEIEKEELLNVIMEERKLELFSEWGHRWFDLKRTGRASAVLSSIKPQWQDIDKLYPVPEEERIKNPNLSQNEGY